MNLCTTIFMLASMLPEKYVAAAAEADACVYEPTDVVEVEVSVEYYPGHYGPARRSGHPDNWTPDESEAAEIISVEIDGGGDDITQVIDQKTRSLLQKRIERHRDEQFDEPDDYDYARFERRRFW